MKIADHPPHFIDPPNLSAESEEEMRLFGYPNPDVPSMGKEPLRVRDLILFRTYQRKTITYAQVLEIRSFEYSREYNRPTLRLNDPYLIQNEDRISRVYTMNYKMGELEDNRKWAHSPPLHGFILVKSVICKRTGISIKWNRRGTIAEVHSGEIAQLVSKMHKNAENDLARSFLNLNSNPQLLSSFDDQVISEDATVYDEIEDICHNIFSHSQKDDFIESSDEVPNNSNVDDSKTALPKCMVTDLCSVSSSETLDNESSDLDQSSIDDIASLEDVGSISRGGSPMVDNLSSGNEAYVEEGDGALLSHDEMQRISMFARSFSFEKQRIYQEHCKQYIKNMHNSMITNYTQC